jgi:outer membrane protein insertion porin family
LIGLMAMAEGQTLVFQGLRDFSEKDARESLDDQWKEIQKKGLTASRANDAAYFFKLALRQQGYTEADVVSRILEGNVLQLTVEEGQPLLLGKIALLGVNALDAALLKEAMVKEMKGRQSLLERKGDLPFVKGAIVRGVGAIESYAGYEGFLRATAELESFSKPNKDRRVDVTVRVNEGPAFKIKSVTIMGLEEPLFGKVEDAAEPSVGRPLNAANVRGLQGAVLRDLNERGYFDATVEVTEGKPDESFEETAVDVVIAVMSGPVYRVGHIEVIGHQALPASFVEKRFKRMMGDAYDPIEVRRVYREFAQTGLYENIEITPVPAEAGIMTLQVEVEEAKFRQLGPYGGFGSFDGYILGTRYINRNLFGTRRSLQSQLEVNGRGIQGELNYLDRWFVDSRWRFGVQINAGTRELLGYDKWELGALASFSYDLSDHASLSFYSGFDHVSLTANRFVDAEIRSEDYQVQTFGLSYRWDHREDLEPDGHGYLFDVNLDYATSFLIGDVSFLRSQMRLAHYWKLPWETELRLGARIGAMQPLGDTDVIPVDLRFFSGGGQSVRSFPERELGPQDRRGHPTGGEFYTVFNAEYSIPLRDSFYLAVFADVGNLLDSIDNISLDDMHFAAGLGLRYDLPIGPLRVDYGFNLNREQGEPTGSFHVGFGFAF